jgi:Mannosyltransferase (PIG-V)
MIGRVAARPFRLELLRVVPSVKPDSVVWAAVVAFAGSRLVLIGVGLWSMATFPLTTDGNGPWSEWNHLVPMNWVAMFSRWDGRWFMYVARDGYSFVPGQTGESDASFAPLLPGLMWLGAHFIGWTDTQGLLAVGVVVSQVAFLLALVYLALLVSRTGNRPLAVRTVVCLAIFPLSFFFSATYAEAVFLAPAVAAFVYAAEGRWWLAGLAGALAVLARTYGILILVPLAFEYLVSTRFRVGPQIAWLGLIPAAFVAWMAYMWLQTGDPLAMIHAQALWHRNLMPPWQTFHNFFSARIDWFTFKSNHSGLDLLFTLGYGVLVALAWRLKRKSLPLFATLLYLPMISTNLLSSVPRFGLELFPAFVVLGQLTAQRWRLLAYCLVSGAGLVYLMARWAVGYWVA